MTTFSEPNERLSGPKRDSTSLWHDPMVSSIRCLGLLIESIKYQPMYLLHSHSSTTKHEREPRRCVKRGESSWPCMHTGTIKRLSDLQIYAINELSTRSERVGHTFSILPNHQWMQLSMSFEQFSIGFNPSTFSIWWQVKTRLLQRNECIVSTVRGSQSAQNGSKKTVLNYYSLTDW